jgi:Domain of unknown function (DUF1707)
MRHLDVTHLDPFPGCAFAADTIRMDPQGFNTNSRLRASDADRDRAASVLNEALAEGRLTPGQHSEQLDSIHAAKTRPTWCPHSRIFPPWPTPHRKRKRQREPTGARCRTGSASASASWSSAASVCALTTASQCGQAAAMPAARGW